MALTSSELKRLLDCGITPEAILAVTEIIEARDAKRPVMRDDSDERRRAAAAARAQRYRDKRKNQSVPEAPASPDNNASVTVIKRDDTVTMSQISPIPPKDINLNQKGIEEGNRKVNARGTRLPSDFVPDATAEALARELKFTKADWTRTQQEFRDYWAGVPGAKGCKLDWQATFRNSIRRYAERKPYGKSTHQTDMAAAFDNLERKIGEHSGPSDGAGGPQPPDDSGLTY